MNKYVLFIAPSYMDLYIDVIEELERQGYIVDFIPEQRHDGDPYNVRGYRRYGRIFTNPFFFQTIKKYWINKLNEQTYSKKYNYLFVLDGQSLHPCIFDILRKRNINIRCINYLFDTTTGVYEFHRNFKFFDYVATFDSVEANKYGIDLLPIFWLPVNSVECFYSVFGMGAHNYLRYDIFNKIKNICINSDKKYFLKLYIKPINLSIFGKLIEIIKINLSSFKRRSVYNELKTDLITHEFMSPTKFRSLIACSKVIVDTSPSHQVGLTARFMWALGAQKKIITTNENVREYSFFSPEQIFVINKKTDDFEIKDFIETPMTCSGKHNDTIIRYRVDKWIEYLFSK